MRRHVVRQGECLSAIAMRYGFREHRTLYDHPENAELRRRRPDPNVIHPGDVVVIPEMESREEDAVTARVHRYRVSKPKRVLRVRLLGDDGQPLRSVPYELRVGSVSRSGTTDGEGGLEELVPHGEDTAWVETESDLWELALGDLNPLEHTDDAGISGAQARLLNLGYSVGAVDGIWGPRTRAAVQAFQEDQGLARTARLDAETRRALERAHGS